MIEARSSKHDSRDGDGRQAGHLVGRDAEMDRIRAFVASARTDGGAPLVTGEPGVGKTRMLDAAAEAASTVGPASSMRPTSSSRLREEKTS